MRATHPSPVEINIRVAGSGAGIRVPGTVKRSAVGRLERSPLRARTKIMKSAAGTLGVQVGGPTSFGTQLGLGSFGIPVPPKYLINVCPLVRSVVIQVLKYAVTGPQTYVRGVSIGGDPGSGNAGPSKSTSPTVLPVLLIKSKFCCVIDVPCVPVKVNEKVGPKSAVEPLPPSKPTAGSTPSALAALPTERTNRATVRKLRI